MSLLRHKKKVDRQSGRIVLVHLNVRIRPVHRGEIFEDPLNGHFLALGLPAAVVGGVLTAITSAS